MARYARVLIAEMDASSASSLHTMLEKLGCYEVLGVFHDSVKLVTACTTLLPDVAIINIEFPAIDGQTPVRQISEELDIPVIVLSSHGHPNLIEHAVNEGASQFLTSPPTLASLHGAIQTTLAQVDKTKGLREKIATLENTLRERKMIERAKGILMTRRGMSEPEAFRLLQRQSQDRRISMARLAEMIMEAEQLLEGTVVPSGPRDPHSRINRPD